jgi:hypothetical protein
MTILGKKKIKKRPGSTSAYFTNDTQESIKKFQEDLAGKARDQIFEREILPALKKMVEYWVYVYGLESPTQSKEELVQSCVGFLHDSIHKWDPERSTKAFSYFNVVSRNWLINTVNNHKKQSRRDISINDIELESVLHNKDVDENLVTQSVERDIIDAETIMGMKMRVKKIRNGLDDERDLVVMEAIEKVFDLADSLDFINRSALFIYIRDLCGYDKRTISRSMSRIRKVYKQISDQELQS